MFQSQQRELSKEEKKLTYPFIIYTEQEQFLITFQGETILIKHDCLEAIDLLIKLTEIFALKHEEIFEAFAKFSLRNIYKIKNKNRNDNSLLLEIKNANDILSKIDNSSSNEENEETN